MNTIQSLMVGCLGGLLTWHAVATSADSFKVTWDSPSLDHHGSMPLGNGDVALNVWMADDGDLEFYISKTDAWDDYGRLLKVGKIRLRFEPGLIVPGGVFRQELKLSEGCLEIVAGPAGSTPTAATSASVRVWVDANHPVVHVTAQTPEPVSATAFVELWRTNEFEAEIQVSDVLLNRKLASQKQAPLMVQPDTVLSDQRDRIGWFHHNARSVGPQMMAEIQGLTGYHQPDPLRFRTFGAVVTAERGERLDDLRLRSPRGTSHRFSVFVLTRHPATPERWRADMDDTIRHVERQDFTARRAAHGAWWKAFWDRSWIRATTSAAVKRSPVSMVPANRHPVRIGMDQQGGNPFAGELGRVSIFDHAINDAEARLFANTDRKPLAMRPEMVHSGATTGVVSNSTGWQFENGLSIEAWVKPERLSGGGGRIVDDISIGGSDGFLLDTHPGNSLRFICGDIQLSVRDTLPAGQWTHVAAVADPLTSGCRLYVNGKIVADNTQAAIRDEAAYVSQMYQLQRFVTACAGRGAYPIKFNGSLFTVPPGPTEKDPDYRRWGPGYWWQNTRLPYISLCTSGDFDLQRPLFRLYAEELLPLCKYRTRLYFGHDGAFYPECMMFWGAVFSESYGWTPFEQREDKLQESGWHKWEWVGGLELAWMLLDYYDHTLDGDFLRQTALPVTREVLTFFERHYPTNAQGQLVMHPAQALETWWHCTNATPELAGCMAVTERVFALRPDVVSTEDRALSQRLRAMLPPIPLREINGRYALAPAEFFAQKNNIENPELYPVFPFRLFAFNRPNADWAHTALEHRWDRGHSGWRQDDIFMAYLGLAADARRAMVSRARNHDPGERFPAFWGPNYDWTPDQDHGGVLMKAFQAMLLQTDGPKIFLLPAWPKEWNVEFRLHAPQQTIVEGAYQDGRMVSLRVTPESRRTDVEVLAPQ